MKKVLIYIIAFCFITSSCNISKPIALSDNIILRNYQPFTEFNKTARLSETATLKLEHDLPKIDGATALYPLYAAFVQAIYPEGDYFYQSRGNFTTYEEPLVGASTTASAYNRLIEGKVDIIFCAKPSIEQTEMVRNNGMEFIMIPIGSEAFVFFINVKNPVSNISTDDIIGIYSGRITNWSKLGGNRSEIRAYQRTKNSGSQTMLESIMGEEKLINSKTENELTFMLDIINRTADYRNYRNALGFSFLFYTTQMVQNNNIKLLSINNILPTKETIQNGTYPYCDNFYAIILNNNTDNENINLFIKWILSEQGQYLVEKTGYVPIR